MKLSIRPLIKRCVILAAVTTVFSVAGARAAQAQSVAVFGGASSTSLTANAVCPPNGGVCSATTTSNIGMRVPQAMTLSSLYAFQSTAPAKSSSCTFIVRVSPGGTGAYSSTALSCSITSTSSRTCANTGSSVPVNAGDIIQILFVESGTCSGYVNFGLTGAF